MRFRRQVPATDLAWRDLTDHARAASTCERPPRGRQLATTRTRLAEGARVVAVSRNTTAELDELAGEDLVHVSADLMDPDAPAQVVSRTVDAFGGPDILVNNAGGPPPGTHRQ